MDRLKVSRELASRYLNDGFSGGEKKRVEILQMAMLKPRIAVLDETDSGLDIDALRVVAGGVNELVGPEMGALVITHYQRILELHHARSRPRLRGRAYRGVGRRRAREEARGGRLRPLHSEQEPRRDGTDRDRRRQGNPQRVQVRLLEPRRGEGLLLQVRSRPVARAGRGDRRAQERARLDAEVPAQEPRLLLRAPAAAVGRQPERHRLREHLLLHQADRESGEVVGGPAGRHPGHVGQARASRRRRRSTSPASARSTSRRSSTTSCRRISRRRA